MANHASSKKRIRQTAKRTIRRKNVRTGVRTFMKRVRAAISSGDGKAAATALADAIKRIDRAVAKGVFHRRTGSRYIARLTQQVEKLGKKAA
jgi:small subunit ribosomal protein S20